MLFQRAGTIRWQTAIQRLASASSRMPYDLSCCPILPSSAMFVVILPLFINFLGYSLTGGTKLLPEPTGSIHRGRNNTSFLMDCGRLSLEPAHLPRGQVLARHLSIQSLFVFFQVSFHGSVFSGDGVDPQSRDPRAGLFSRRFFLPSASITGGRCALIWKWILLRDGLSECLPRVHWSRQDPVLYRVPTWAMFWADICVDLGAYGVLHANPACRPAGHPARPLRSRGDGRDQQGTRFLADHTCRCLWPNMLVVIVLALIKGVQIFDEVLRPDRRWTGHRDAIYRAIYLQCWVHQSDPELWLWPRPHRWCWVWCCSLC